MKKRLEDAYKNIKTLGKVTGGGIFAVDVLSFYRYVNRLRRMTATTNTDDLRYAVCKYYATKPSECTKTTCEVRSKLSASIKYCPIYFCKISDIDPTIIKQTNTDSQKKPRTETSRPSSPPIFHKKSSLNDSTVLLYKTKRKAALIGVLTLGLAGLSVIGVGETWRMNIFSGTSFDKGGVGFIMKIVSFCLISLLVAVPCFIISIIQLISYSIKLSH